MKTKKVQWMKIKELMAVKTGSVDPKKFPNELFDLYSIPSFDKGKYETVLGNEIGSSKQIVQPNDVLLSKIVPHIRRAWVVRDDNDRRMIASGEWIVFRSNITYPDYLSQVIKGDFFHKKFMETVAGVGGSLLRARPALVANIQIPLPPLPKQIVIANILSKAEALIAKRKESLALLDEYLKSTFLELFGDPVRNEKGWEVKSISDVCEEIVDCVNRTAPVLDIVTPFVMIRTSNIRYGQINLENVKYVSEDTYTKWTRRSIPQKGDVLFTREAPLGEVAMVTTNSKIFLGQRIMQYRSNRERLNPYYLLFTMKTKFFLNQIEKLAKGSTVKHLQLPDCYQFRIQIPPLELQNQFASIVEKVEALKEKYQKGLGELANLYGSLSQRAFRGEL